MEPPLVGRKQEIERVERFGAGAAGGGLLLEGPPGIGKTSLWNHGISCAQENGVTVLSARAVAGPLTVAFSGLVELCEAVDLEGSLALPAPQLDALSSATGRRDPLGGGASQEHAVAAGLLALLRAMSAQASVLVAVDNLPSLDPATTAALTYVARRLAGVGFLVTANPGWTSPLRRTLERSELTRISIAPLDRNDTRRLLTAHYGVKLARREAERIFLASEGNPLYVLELGRALLEQGEAVPPGELRLPPTVDELFVRRIERLDGPVRRLLLASALARGGRTAALPGIEALDDALEAGVVTINGGRIRPAHPLLATTAVYGASPAERRLLHLELAASTSDEEERSYHRALATDEPDESIAAALLAGAALAAGRHDAASAAELGAHAWRLTEEGSPERVTRLLTLVEYLVAAGELDRGRSLLGPELMALPRLARARACLLACALDLPPPNPDTPAIHRHWLDLALADSVGDANLRADVVSHDATYKIFVDVVELREAESSIAFEVLTNTGMTAETRMYVLFDLAWVRAMLGQDIIDLLAAANGLESDSARTLPAAVHLDRVAAVQAMWRGDLVLARQEFERMLRLADERGESESYFYLRNHLCEIELRAGNLDAAHRWLEAWSDEGDHPIAGDAALARGRAMLEGLRGNGEEARRLADDAIALATTLGDRWQWLEAKRARGIILILAGEMEEAALELHEAWRHVVAAGLAEHGAFPLAADLVESLVPLGERDLATSVAEAITTLARSGRHPWAEVTSLRCRAMLDPSIDGSRDGLTAAAEQYGQLGYRFERARSLLFLGRLLAASGQRRESRATLEHAVAAFDDIGAGGWAERAKQELVGQGSTTSFGTSLSPSERRVAELVAAGRRNSEVAAELYVSVKTVEAHLSRIYGKLGVRSRTELARRLREVPRGSGSIAST